MKITANTGVSVNVSSLKEPGALLKNLKPGDTVSASLIKSEGKKALLDIGGRIITAEFTNGVPGGKNIELVLTAKTADRILFSLKENEPGDKLIKLLTPFTLLHEDDVKKNSLQNFARFINASRPDLMEINRFLLGFTREREKDRRGAVFFNHLLQKGIPMQTLVDISYLIYSRHDPSLFISYQYLLMLSGRKPLNSMKEDKSLFEKALDDLFEVIKENDPDFYVMLDMIYDDHRNGGIGGEIVFPDDETFSEMEYLRYEDSVFLRFDLTAGGVIDIFIKNGKDQVFINFFSAGSEFVLFLKENENLLREMLEENGVKKSIIGYFDSKKMVDKLELWSLDFYTKSGFNVKV